MLDALIREQVKHEEGNTMPKMHHIKGGRVRPKARRNRRTPVRLGLTVIHEPVATLLASALLALALVALLG